MTCYNSELPIGPPGPQGPAGPPGPPGSGSGSSLTATLFIGNTTDGEDINLTLDDAIVVDNNSKLKRGTVDNGFGGGISLICSNEKEQQWENGVRYLRVIDGTNVYAETLDALVVPNSSYNSLSNWATNSRFKNLVTGIEYICTDAVSGAWLPLSGTWTPTFTNIAGGVSNITPGLSLYSIQGNICTCSIKFSCDINFSGAFDTGTIEINTPIAITSSLEMVGTGQQQGSNQFNVIAEKDNITIYLDGGFVIISSAVFLVNYQFEID
jgi:hypothetical protein